MTKLDEVQVASYIEAMRRHEAEKAKKKSLWWWGSDSEIAYEAMESAKRLDEFLGDQKRQDEFFEKLSTPKLVALFCCTLGYVGLMCGFFWVCWKLITL